MPDTITCPRCSRTVPWTNQDWSVAEQCCTRCAGGSSSLPTSAADVGPTVPNRGGIAVRMTGLDVSFGDLVVFMIKLTFASIPAGLLLAVFYFIVMTLLGYEL